MSGQVKNIYDILRVEFGEHFTIYQNRRFDNVDIADKVIAQNDPNRLALIIINLSANIVYIRPINQATSTAGIVISALGGLAAFNIRDDFVLQSLEWHAIAAADNSDVLVIELVSI